jgi:hypothetical protein
MDHTSSGIPFIEPADVLIDYPAVSLELATELASQLGTTGALPAAPGNGERCCLWHGSGFWDLVYDASVNRWWYVGGAPAYGFNSGDVGLGAWAGIPPIVNIPCGGEYLVAWGFEYYDTAPATSDYVMCVVVGPGRGVVDMPALAISPIQGGTLPVAGVTERLCSFLGSSTVQPVAMTNSTAGAAVLRQIWLRVTPRFLDPAMQAAVAPNKEGMADAK